MKASEPTVIQFPTAVASPSEDRLLTYAEVSAMLGVKVNTLYTWVRRNQIPVVRVGPRTVRFRLSDIRAICDGRGQFQTQSESTT